MLRGFSLAEVLIAVGIMSVLLLAAAAARRQLAPKMVVVKTAAWPLTVAFAPDNATMAVECSGGQIQLFSKISGLELLSFHGDFTFPRGLVGYTDDGRVIVHGKVPPGLESRVVTWKPGFAVNPRWRVRRPCLRDNVSSDGQVSSERAGDRLLISDAQGNEIYHLPEIHGEPTSAAFAVGCSLVVVGYQDGETVAHAKFCRCLPCAVCEVRLLRLALALSGFFLRRSLAPPAAPPDAPGAGCASA